MNRRDLELNKQLLLLKGEALRLRLQLELEHWRAPAQIAAEGIDMWGSMPRLRTLLELLLVMIPASRWRKLLWLGSKGVAIYRLIRKLMHQGPAEAKPT
jgi:hypothetical protein